MVCFRRCSNRYSDRQWPCNCTRCHSHLAGLWFLPSRKCVGILQNIGWIVQPCCTSHNLELAVPVCSICADPLVKVTLALVLTGNVPWFRGLVLLPAQLLGGIVAAALARCMLPGPLLVNTTLGAGTTPAQGVFIEMFLTALLVFTILMLAAEKHYATFMAPVGIGLALFVGMMAGKSFSSLLQIFHNSDRSFTCQVFTIPVHL